MPGSPTYVQVANNSTANSLDFSFKRSNDDNGSSGDTYDIRYSTAAQMTNPTTHLDYITATGADNYSGTTPTSLSSGTTYYFQVRFKDSSARQHSSWADTAGQDYATTDSGAPDAPGAPTAAPQDVDFEEIILTWTAVSGATAYRLYVGEGTSDPTSLYVTLGNVTTYTVTGQLDQAQIYSFRLKAGNNNGYSGYGPTFTQSTTMEEVPELNDSSNLATSNVLSWTVEDTDAGEEESVLYGDTSNPPTTIIYSVDNDGAKSYTHTGLSASTTYYYKLHMYVDEHNNAHSRGQVTTITNPANVPDTPGTPAVGAKNDTTITFNWTNPGGATSYKLYFGTDNPPTNINNGTQTTTYTYKQYTSLSVATTYHFRIRATNDGGDSGQTSSQTTTTSTVAAGQPTTPTSVTPVSQTISWTNPAGTTTAFLYYGTSANPTTLLTSGAGLATYSHLGLVPGTTYYYRTRTQTYYHDDFFSAYSSDQSGATLVVSVPTSIQYVASSTTQFLLVWSNPTYSDRTYIYSADHSNLLVDLGTPDYSTSNSVTMGGQYVQTGPPIQVNLGQNTGWNLKLKNYYDGYSSGFANFTGYTLPGPPTSFSATALSDTEIQLAWTAPSKGSTYLSQTYTIQRKLSGGSYSNIATGQTGASYTDSGLTQGTQYYYKIKTTTTAGSSTYATEDNATTQTGPDPVAGDALGLGALGHAVGINGNATSQTSISACNGGGTSEVKMSDYYCGSVGNLTGNMFIDPNQTTTFTANFNNRGSKFNSRIGIEDGNFTWTSDNTGIATVETNADRTCVITGGSSVGSTTIRMTFAGRYNTHSSIPSTQKTRTIVVTNMP